MSAQTEAVAAVEPRYSVGTWDADLQAYTPHGGVRSFNLTLAELRQAIRDLRDCGYSCHRFRDADGEHDDNDHNVLIERTEGMTEDEILESWKR